MLSTVLDMDPSVLLLATVTRKWFPSGWTGSVKTGWLLFSVCLHMGAGGAGMRVWLGGGGCSKGEQARETWESQQETEGEKKRGVVKSVGMCLGRLRLTQPR